MKIHKMQMVVRIGVAAGLLGLAVWPAAAGLRAVGPKSDDPNDLEVTPEAKATAGADVTLEKSTESEPERKDVPWLGVSTAEASDALTSQLDLQPGVGLVINYVAPNSPAAKAGLRKNDVLTRFDDQALVHPAQLRKLVRVRQPGAKVELQFYRGGKAQTLSLELGQTRLGAGLGGDGALKDNWEDLQHKLQDMHLDEAIRDQMRALKESLGNIHIDQKEVQEDIRRGMEQARRAIQEALRNVTNVDSTLNPVRQILENLAHSGVQVDDKADVVVRSSGKDTRSLVQSDDSGTLVLLNKPTLHLTAHDQDGKLQFDGPIETAEQRAKVPPELWKRVEPLLDQMHPQAERGDPKQ